MIYINFSLVTSPRRTYNLPVSLCALAWPWSTWDCPAPVGYGASGTWLSSLRNFACPCTLLSRLWKNWNHLCHWLRLGVAESWGKLSIWNCDWLKLWIIALLISWLSSPRVRSYLFVLRTGLWRVYPRRQMEKLGFGAISKWMLHQQPPTTTLCALNPCPADEKGDEQHKTTDFP